ncbi:helix-turn-helix domain-containing protein [Weissella paramesenteroides]|uniref:helix-turn-helix domain-containing protein n=1 Tax=Weissella paramesenteroides TaxID=1249 RepID=UPI003D36880C
MDSGNKQVMANNIKYYLAKNSKSARDVIRDLNLKSTTVYDWINTRTYPRIDKIESMATYFNIDKSALIDEYDNSTNDLKVYIDDHPIPTFGGTEIPESEMKIIKRILENMDDK